MQRKIVLLPIACIMLSLLTGCLFEARTTTDMQIDSSVTSADITTESTSNSQINSQVISEESAEITTTENSISETTRETADPMKDGMIFPNSDEELILWKDLVPLSLEQLAFARNDFFAREGYVFQKQKYIDHYDSLVWYEPDDTFTYDRFSEIQQVNIHLIQIAEARAGNGLLYIPSGTTLDFDQDGDLEELTYEAPNEFSMNIVLHDTDDDRHWDIDCTAPFNKMYIGDILYDDGILDLFADEMGASDDYSSYVAGVTSEGFVERGMVSGSCDDVTLSGNGIISTSGRMHVMMTWYVHAKYVLETDGSLIYEAEPEYSIDDFPCTAIVDVPMRSVKDTSMAPDLSIPAGTTAYLVSTDNIEWVKIRWGDQEGWLHLTKFSTITDLDTYASMAFEGLIIAD